MEYYDKQLNIKIVSSISIPRPCEWLIIDYSSHLTKITRRGFTDKHYNVQSVQTITTCNNIINDWYAMEVQEVNNISSQVD